MNWQLLVAGFVALSVVGGHFTIGSKQYLQPMLAASFDEVAKKVMHCVFHYVSVYLVISTAVLLALGFGIDLGGNSSLVVKFIAKIYALFAVTQIGIAMTSKIQNGLFKMFQWIFFVLIAFFAWLGA